MKAHYPKQLMASLVGVLVATTGATAAVQLAGASAASAVTGLIKVNGTTSAIDSQPSKTVHADCPTGTRVIGGGGWTNAVASADAAKVALVELQPVHPASGLDTYEVTAQSVTPNITTNWWVQAYAICASPVSGMHIVTQTSPIDTLAADSWCPTGEQPLGGGGKVNNPANHVALVGVTPLSTGGKITAEIRTDTPGYTGTWTVTSYAVCAPTPPGYQVVFALSTGGPSDTTKVATITCPAGKRVHGAGATVRSGAPTGLGLQVMYPFNALDEVEASAVETTPTDVDWQPIVAVAICAN